MRKPLAVIRRGFIDGRWYVCHAVTYQNAIRHPTNGTTTRAAAVVLAESAGFEVQRHDTDPAQKEV